MKRHDVTLERIDDHSHRERRGDLKKRSPERAFLSSLHDMERMFEEALHVPFFGVSIPRALRTVDRMIGFTPSVDVVETKGEVTVKAELPGMTREDISLRLDHNCLIISGEKKASEKTEREGFITMERSYGMFHRSIMLPEGIDASHVTATCKDGILEVHIPRKEGETSRTIPVN